MSQSPVYADHSPIVTARARSTGQISLACKGDRLHDRSGRPTSRARVPAARAVDRPVRFAWCTTVGWIPGGQPYASRPPDEGMFVGILGGRRVGQRQPSSRSPPPGAIAPLSGDRHYLDRDTDTINRMALAPRLSSPAGRIAVHGGDDRSDRGGRHRSALLATSLQRQRGPSTKVRQ